MKIDKMRLIFLVFFLSFIPFFVVAQEEIMEEELVDAEPYVPRFSIGIEFNVGVPVAEFKNNIDGVSYGGSGSFLFRINPNSEMPVMIGLSGGVVTYDSESQDQIILIDGFQFDTRLITRNSIFLGHSIFRILPPLSETFQPYFDGMIGFKNLYTRTTLEDRDAFEDDTLESYIEQGDWAFSYGGAIGIQWLVGGSEEVYILLDGRCVYLQGNNADYLVRSSDPNIQIIDTIDAFEERNSSTDMVIPQIGLTFIF